MPSSCHRAFCSALSGGMRAIEAARKRPFRCMSRNVTRPVSVHERKSAPFGKKGRGLIGSHPCRSCTNETFSPRLSSTRKQKSCAFSRAAPRATQQKQEARAPREWEGRGLIGEGFITRSRCCPTQTKDKPPADKPVLTVVSQRSSTRPPFCHAICHNPRREHFTSFSRLSLDLLASRTCGPVAPFGGAGRTAPSAFGDRQGTCAPANRQNLPSVYSAKPPRPSPRIPGRKNKRASATGSYHG